MPDGKSDENVPEKKTAGDEKADEPAKDAAEGDEKAEKKEEPAAEKPPAKPATPEEEQRLAVERAEQADARRLRRRHQEGCRISSRSSTIVSPIGTSSFPNRSTRRFT